MKITAHITSKFVMVLYFLLEVNPIFSQIILRSGIGPIVIDSTKTLTLHMQPPSIKTEKILQDLLSMQGSRNDKCYVLESLDINVARVGLDKNNREVILVNPKHLDVDKEMWPTTAILAHELGHIFGRHLIDSAITKDHELDADYYSGFLLRKLKCNNIELVKAPYKKLGEDSTHPPFVIREKKIEEGWNEGGREITLGLTELKTSQEIKRDSLVDLFLLVSEIPPPPKRPDLKFRVTMSIKSQDKVLSRDELFSSVRKVRYYLHHTMDKNPIPWFYSVVNISKSTSNPSFSHRILVWGDFPIKAKIFFNDRTKLTIKRKFHLN